MNTRNRSGKVDSEQYNAKWNQRVKIIPSKVPKEIIKENRTKIENTKERLFKLASKLITNEIRMINRDINARKQPILITGPDESNLKRCENGTTGSNNRARTVQKTHKTGPRNSNPLQPNMKTTSENNQRKTADKRMKPELPTKNETPPNFTTKNKPSSNGDNERSTRQNESNLLNKTTKYSKTRGNPMKQNIRH
ncbi:hypothetical protein M8J76_001236 [Diaphorina citri]|nr:hypothetical protein M8J76_001236 [Diaphorina citri]